MNRPRAKPGLVPVARGYRPHLDGLRAVAVLMVLAQHTLGASLVDLGAVGVGLFFSLSGYLITSLLLDERDRRGTVSLLRFYVRRAARLVPALVLVVAVCDVLFLLQGDLRPLKGSLFALTYTANYALVLQPGSVGGFGPTWSLAVEEHFYIVWPLALLLVTRRWGLRAALAATVAVCVIAVLWREVLVLADVYRELVAIGSVERADAMLWGCVAALALRLGWRPPAGAAWVGAAVVASLPFVFKDNAVSLVLGNAVLAIAGTALVVGLDHSVPGPLHRALSLRPLVALGILSYGVYLWQGPLMRVANNAGFQGRGWRAVVAVGTIGVAAASYRWVEAPVRAWARRRTAEVPHVAAEPVAR